MLQRPPFYLFFISAYGVVVSMYVFHCDGQGSNLGRGGEILYN